MAIYKLSPVDGRVLRTNQDGSTTDIPDTKYEYQVWLSGGGIPDPAYTAEELNTQTRATTATVEMNNQFTFLSDKTYTDVINYVDSEFASVTDVPTLVIAIKSILKMYGRILLAIAKRVGAVSLS